MAENLNFMSAKLCVLLASGLPIGNKLALDVMRRRSAKASCVAWQLDTRVRTPHAKL